MPDLAFKTERLGLVGASNAYRSLAYGAQVSINLYGELGEDPQARQKGIGALYGCPGRHSLADLGGAVYGLWSNTNRLFVVCGSGSGRDLVELNSGGGEISRHNFTSHDDGKPAQIISNASQLLICSGGLLYCDNGIGPVQVFFTDGVTPVTAVTIAYLDGYGIAQRPAGPLSESPTQDGGRQFNISAILDFTSWSTLDNTNAEAEPSYITQLWADNEQLYVFKDASFQVYQNNPSAGVGGFPFANMSGAMAKYGSISHWGNVSLGGKVYFLGFPGGPGNAGAGWISAYVLDGFTPRRISGKAQEAHWNSAGLGLNSISYAYTEDGHDFWCINFGTETWCFDSTTGAWHQRASWDGSVFGIYKNIYHTFVQNWGTSGYHITGGTLLSTKVYISSVNFYDDDGSDVAWQRAIPYEYGGANLIYYGRMYLEAETGTVPSGAAPDVTREYSDDRGQTFIGSETASLGINSDFSVRLVWPMAPYSNSMGRVFRFSGHGKYKVALIDLQADVAYGVT